MTDDDDVRVAPNARCAFCSRCGSRGVTDPRVLEAMERIDRGEFVRGHFEDRAYEDTPLPIPCGQTISQPLGGGLMTQALEVGPRDKVLEVGPARAIRRRSCRFCAAVSIRWTATAAW